MIIFDHTLDSHPWIPSCPNSIQDLSISLETNPVKFKNGKIGDTQDLIYVIQNNVFALDISAFASPDCYLFLSRRCPCKTDKPNGSFVKIDEYTRSPIVRRSYASKML